MAHTEDSQASEPQIGRSQSINGHQGLFSGKSLTFIKLPCTPAACFHAACWGARADFQHQGVEHHARVCVCVRV